MPLEPADFPAEVQVAFFIFALLSDRWEGMSGSYLGKDCTCLNDIFDLYEVEDRREVFYFMKMYESLIVQKRAEEQESQRKAAEKKSAGSGKNYTHNVKG